MAKEKILAMEAGNQLDVLVRREVFGVKVELCPTCGKYHAPIYSKDFSAAFQVVDKMFELGYAMSLLHLSSEFYPEYWYCDFRPKDSNKPPEYEWVDHQMTAPVAICKAALLTRLEGAR